MRYYGDKYTVTYRVPLDASQEYREYALQALRHEVGLKLFETLNEHRLPAVVDIEEILPSDSDYRPTSVYGYLMPQYDELRINIYIKPVQYQDVVVSREVYERHPLPVKKQTWWDKVKSVFKR